MQTFIPFPDFDASARALDNRRLGKQRVEAYQILQALADPAYGWQSHPAVTMWRGHDAALTNYYAAICREWIRRGFRHTLPVMIEYPPDLAPLPAWLGDWRVHVSHRGMLWRKNSTHYAHFAGAARLSPGYVWPGEKEQ